MNKKFVLLLLCTFFVVTSAFSYKAFSKETELSLELFLKQVKNNNKNLRGSHLISTGVAQRVNDGELLLAPTFFSTYNYLSDKKETAAPSFQGTSTRADMYSIGIQKLTNFGLSAKLSYSMMHTNIKDAALITIPNYYTAYPQLDINFSFLRNGFGSEVKAQQIALEAANKATSYSEAFKEKISLVEAEKAYWRLALARKALLVRKEVRDRAQKILSWATRRVKTQLGDRSDMLQAQAGLELRKLELIEAQNEVRTAALAFNSARNIESDIVPESLTAIAPELLTDLSPIDKNDTRLDIKAAEQIQLIALANAQLAKEKAKPSLDVFASAALNGRDANKNTARSESLTSKYPTNSIGVTFSTPLYFGLSSNIFSGTEKEKQGAILNYEHKLFEQEQEWNDLNSRLKEAQSRLKLTKTIESIQKEKHENEQARLLRGRTTTYQALLFEQDYAQAQLIHIRTQAEILGLYTQLKIFQNTGSGLL